MSSFSIYLQTSASSVITVEAETLDEAIDLAYDDAPSVCAQCSGWGQRAGIELGDWELDEEATADLNSTGGAS